MISFTKKNKQQDDVENTYGAADTGYAGYSGYGTDYDGGDFSDEGAEDTADFKEPVAVDPMPVAEKSTIKLLKFSSAAEREQVADCLKSGYAVIFDLSALERGDWFRVIDYIQGAIYMIGGKILRFSENSLIAAPMNSTSANWSLTISLRSRRSLPKRKRRLRLRTQNKASLSLCPNLPDGTSQGL